MTAQFHNSGDVVVNSEGEQGFGFISEGRNDIIRRIVHIPEHLFHQCVDIRVKIAIQLEEGRIGHISLVNGDVSEGRIIDFPDHIERRAEFEIGGVFRPLFCDALLVITLLGPTKGHIELTHLSVTHIEVNEGPRVLFFIEPWLDRNDAFSKEVYIDWFRHQAAALQQAMPEYRFMMVCNEVLLYSLDMEHIPFPTKGISQESLLEIFISFRQAMTEWCKTGASPRATKASAELVKRELADFEPDIILATAPAPYLEIAYPEALLLYADGLYFRPPWPDGSPMFDPTGHQQAALIAQMAREISVDSSAPEFMDAYRGIVDRDMAALRAFTIGKIEFLRQRFNKIVVLGLQDFRHHFAFTAQPHETQLDFIIATLNRIPVTVGVIVAQHPDRHDIDTRTMSWLEAKFPNLINDPQFNALKGPSQSLMPFVDGLITTSSGLIYQAAIRLKPAFLTHPTNYSSMSHTRSLDAINEPSSFEIDTLQVDTQMAWILRHHAISHSFLLHTAWLHDRLMRLCDNKRRGNQTWREMPRIAGDATILDWLAKHLRPGIDAIPPV